MLATITILCYWPVLSHQLVSFDDDHYILDSGYVSKGLTWAGAVWAVRTGYFSNWHPLTWLSYMLDAQIYGIGPRGFHLTNLLLHTASSLLVFLLLKGMTRRIWPPAFVAALFAWHPLHVESVAWVSERKDVLCTFFFLLTLFAYFRYANEREIPTPPPNRASRYYLLSLLLFMLALASKQMAVTLPCVLLLVDFWPLRRISFDTSKSRDVVRSGLTLFSEKVPFFVLAFAASVVAFVVQNASGAVSSLHSVSISIRISNSLLAYVAYLSQTFWPAHLAAIYPLAAHFSLVAVFSGAVFLLAVTAFFVLRAKDNPFLIVGWLWFLGTLVPVIGLIQFGSQSHADRYMYIPSIGLSIAFIWGVAALCDRWPRRFQFLLLPSIAVLVVCLFCTRIQVGYWRDSETLFRRAVAAVPGNYLGYNWLGKALDDQSRTEEAMKAWNEAIRLVPEFAEAQYNIGTSLLRQNKPEEALPHLQAAVKWTPNDANAHENLGNAYLKLDKLAEATAQYASAAALAPDNAVFLQVLGSVLVKGAKWNEAASVLADALRLEPSNADANRNYGIALINQGKRPEAIRYFSEAVRLQPNNSDMRFNLGLALLEENQPQRAGGQFSECLRLNPNETRSHYRLAVAFSQQHKVKEAILEYHEALRLTPDFPEAMNELARLLACATDAELRDGTEAVKLAEQACAKTNYRLPNMITTLAAAYAEAGRFHDAIAAAQKARDLAASIGQSSLADKAGELLELCQSGRALRE